jgi:hypothetical protein
VGGLITRRRLAVLAGLVAAAVLPSLAPAGERVLRYSGRVERVDLGEGLVVVDELAARGLRRRHELYVKVDTPIVTAERLRPWEMRGSRAYGEVPVSLVDVLTGDFVVVEFTEEAGRPVALRITIVESTRRPPVPAR